MSLSEIARRLQRVAPQDDRAWRSETGRAHEAFSMEKKKIFGLFDNGQRVMPSLRNFLNNPAVRLSASIKALGVHASREDVHALRGRVSAWQKPSGAIRWHAKKKASGGTRPICILPPELAAVHYMIAAMVEAQLPPSPALYGVPDRSPADAATALKDLQNSGYVHLAKADIKDCFQSINPDALYTLPLPKEVIRQTLDHRHMTFEPPRGASACGAFAGASGGIHGIGHDRNPSGPQGLIQGSPASSIILAKLLENIPRGDANDVAVILCFDNIAIAGKTAAGVRAMMDTLADFFRRCPAGPLELRDITFSDSSGELHDFLGYDFYPDRLKPVIGQRSLNKIEQKLGQAEEDYQITRPLFPTEIWYLLRDIRNGFSAAGDDDPSLARLVESSADVLGPQTGTVADLLHEHIFAPPGTQGNVAIQAILEKYPRQHKQRHKWD